jgi:hypothetical protein
VGPRAVLDAVLMLPCYFIRMVFSGGNIKEALLKLSLHGKTIGEDTFQSFSGNE